jgi:hypothetical protein
MFVNLTNIETVARARGMRWAGHGSHILEMNIACKILGGKPKGKRSLVIPTLRLEDDDLVTLQTMAVAW